MTDNAPAPQAPVSESDERTFGMLTHLSALILGIVGPLIFWLIYKDRSAYLDRQGKEAVNFNILVTIAYVVLFVISVITLGLGSLLYPLVWIGAAIFQIMAGLAANKHEEYRYPVSLRLIK